MIGSKPALKLLTSVQGFRLRWQEQSQLHACMIMHVTTTNDILYHGDGIELVHGVYVQPRTMTPMLLCLDVSYNRLGTFLQSGCAIDRSASVSMSGRSQIRTWIELFYVLGDTAAVHPKSLISFLFPATSKQPPNWCPESPSCLDLQSWQTFIAAREMCRRSIFNYYHKTISLRQSCYTAKFACSKEGRFNLQL